MQNSIATAQATRDHRGPFGAIAYPLATMFVGVIGGAPVTRYVTLPNRPCSILGFDFSALAIVSGMRVNVGISVDNGAIFTEPAGNLRGIFTGFLQGDSGGEDFILLGTGLASLLTLNTPLNIVANSILSLEVRRLIGIPTVTDLHINTWILPK